MAQTSAELPRADAVLQVEKPDHCLLEVKKRIIPSSLPPPYDSNLGVHLTECLRHRELIGVEQRG
jgi:hypothetical protein